MMDQQNRPMKEGDQAPTGPSNIIVEKHKENFLHLHGSFSDKQSENIDRWIEKADEYQAAQMIKSLEMGTIICYCIRGEAAFKIRRMLDSPGTKYVHSNHFSHQEAQEKQPYKPYQDHIPANVATGQLEQLSRPATMPVRGEPFVAKDKCLRYYLLEIYKKKIDLNDAEKFLSTFKTQKPKQTCSNFIDQFIVYYENYSCQRWTKEQRADRIDKGVRDAEMMQLIVNGLCKEFKVYCDNTKLELNTASLDDLETYVIEWQRTNTTGKQFTSECTQAKLPNSMASALELDEYFNAPIPGTTTEEEKTSAAQASTAASRGMKTPRGTRGNNRGTRNGRGRGRGANNSSAGAPRIQIVSRDVMDGNLPNYRQTTDGNLMKSAFGYPLCNYCGKASHKREGCPLKRNDRDNGFTRVNHPDKEKNTMEETKTKTFQTSSVVGMNPYYTGYPLQPQPMMPWPPWPGYQHSPMHNIHNQNGPVQLQNNTGRMETIPRNYNAMHQENVASIMANPCPYPTCQTILTDQNQAIEHMRICHSANNSLAGPGINP